MKLIKLNEEHYIIVDNSEIKEGDFMYDIDGDIGIAIGKDKSQWEGNRKITHSFGKEINGVINKPLSEIEELLFGYNVEELVEKDIKSVWSSYGKPNGIMSEPRNLNRGHQESWLKGFNAHKELVKARFLSTQLYSNENHLEWIYNRLIEVHGENSNYDYMIEFKKIIQSLQPTEWDVEFINGKLTLKQ